jgi:glycosyltransferase involved in cell wall biosynthesis
MSPALAVIIPTYKRTGSLKKLLDILLHQQTMPLEIIVVDQNTGDYFDAAMKALLQQVKWVKQEKPNASDARNRGYLASTAPFLLFIDDDLVPATDFCRQGVDLLLDFPGISCFVPVVHNDLGEEAAIAAARRKYIAPMPGNRGIFSITDTISAAIFFRRDFFLATGGFDNLLFEFAKTAEDQEFFLRMLKKNMPVWFIPFIKVYHDEKIPGGCDLRTDDYWITREKCMKAWTLRFRTRSASGKISAGDFIRLCRSCFVNLEVLKSSPRYIFRQVKLMFKTMNESRYFFNQRRVEYQSGMKNGFIHPGNTNGLAV